MDKMNNKGKKLFRNINFELPSSIIEVVLLKLPSYNLPNCRMVCKQWNDLILACKFDPQFLISNYFFARNRNKIIYVDFDLNPLKGMSTIASFNLPPELSYRSNFYSLSTVTSCNGLLLCLLIDKFSKRQSIFVLNSMTNEYLKLLSEADWSSGEYRYALGFSPKTNQYKIARISIVHDNDILTTLIEISAFGTSFEWTHVGFLPLLFYFSKHVYFNGGLNFFDQELRRNDNIMYRLDVEDEKISEITPPQASGEFSHIIYLNGTLYLTILETDRHLFHVYKMSEDSLWIRAFFFNSKDLPIGSRYLFHLIKICEDGKILFLDGRLDFILYDPKYKTVVILKNEGMELSKKVIAFEKTHLQIGSFHFNSLSKILAKKC